jgi:H+-translocating NAD(P) transhydrogenase subunit alpha
MKVAVLRERYPGERRVSLTPANIPQLAKAGIETLVESGAGVEAGFPDAQFAEKGGQILPVREAVTSADIILQVRTAGMDVDNGAAVREMLRPAQIVIGACDPLGKPTVISDWASTGASVFALELIPRITRAQSMDILSSQATIAGYRAVLVAATELPKMFPMMMTAAGTLAATKVFVIGAGVAGLQAIATARKLGAIVSAYDVRPACKEQVESLGGKFVELAIDPGGAEDKGGYAKALDEDFYQRQRELLANVVAQSDVVVTTAAIPGRPSPLLVTADAVKRMQPGGVIVDLAAERGGNCELSRPDERVHEFGITILGPTNLPADVPYHASQMLGNNVVKFLLNMVKSGELHLNTEDEIIRDTLITHGGALTNERIRSLLNSPA